LDAHPFSYALGTIAFAFLAAYGSALLMIGVGSRHATSSVTRAHVNSWLGLVVIGTIAFQSIFLVQAVLRRNLNWPPNSTPEMLVSRPLYYFGLWAYNDERPRIRQAGKDVQLFFDRHRGYVPFLVEGVVSWGVLGAFFGVSLGLVLRFWSANRWRQVIILGSTALAFLIAARFIFPVQPLGYV
jgi:hypothetical protein